jgi:hypothetical protein
VLDEIAAGGRAFENFGHGLVLSSESYVVPIWKGRLALALWNVTNTDRHCGQLPARTHGKSTTNARHTVLVDVRIVNGDTRMTLARGFCAVR